MKHPSVAQMRQHMRDHVISLSKNADTAGYEIYGLMHMIANLQEAIKTTQVNKTILSGPRLGLLVYLMEEEENGNLRGITPSQLSSHQHVSRNTISALLRGLESQGYIERRLDDSDRRIFRICITEAGRQAVHHVGPQMVDLFNRLVSGLSPEERSQLIDLLSKLFTSMNNYRDFIDEEDKTEVGAKT